MTPAPPDERRIDALLEATSRQMAASKEILSRTRELVERSNDAMVRSLRLLGWEDLERFVSSPMTTLRGH